MATLMEQLKAITARFSSKKNDSSAESNENSPKAKNKEKPQKKAKPKKRKITALYTWEADIERVNGNAEDALKILNDGLEKFPKASNHSLVLSAILFDLGNLDGSLEACEEALKNDPNCLSALRRKGAILEKQGDNVGRNMCYRLAHDIDPLDAFWKDEYADVPPVELPEMELPEGLVIPEPAVEDASNFEMPEEDSFVLELEKDPSEDSFTFEKEGESDEPAVADKSDFEMQQSLESSLDSALAAAESTPVVETPATIEEENMSGNDVSSAIEDFFGDENDAVEEKPASVFSSFEVPSSIEDDEPVQQKPASLFSKSAEEKEAAAPVEEASSDAGLFDKSAESVEDKPTNIDDAFGDIFGEDELPEESSASAPAAEPVAEEPAAEDKPTNIDDAFGDIFGEDELPEENSASAPAAEPAVKEPVAEEDMDFSVPGPAIELEDDSPAESLASLLGDVKTHNADVDLDEAATGESLADILGKLDAANSIAPEEHTEAAVVDTPDELGNGVGDAIGDMFGEDEFPEENSAAPVAEPVAEEPAAEDKPTNIDDAFGDIFGEDELPEEKAQESVASDSAEVSNEPEETLDFGFEKSAEESVAEDLAPVDASVVEEAPAAVEEDNALQSGVDDALGDMFGEDELPEEKSQEAVVDPMSEVPDDADEKLDFVVEDKPVDEVSVETKDDVDGAFASLFGDDDDDLALPTGEPEEAPAEDALSLPEEPVEPPRKENSDLNDEVNSSFEALFGDDDDLDLPIEQASKPTVDLDETLLPPVSSDASMPEGRTGAFEAIFDVNDDAVEEKSAPQDSVDFLMSGDSEDELSQALLKDPTESLDDSAEKIDDSLNTRTLAEIYFEQGLYQKSLDIYKDLAEKCPDDQKIADRLAEVQKIYDEKFGGN